MTFVNIKSCVTSMWSRQPAIMGQLNDVGCLLGGHDVRRKFRAQNSKVLINLGQKR